MSTFTLDTLIRHLEVERERRGTGAIDVFLETEGDEHSINHVESFHLHGDEAKEVVVMISAVARDE